MAEETAVLEPPQKVESQEPKPTPKQETATTRIGDKFRAELSRLKTPEPKKETQKEEVRPTSTDSQPSPLDIATGDKKIEKPAVDDKAWEQEDVVKEFDPQKANWQAARKSLGTQSLEIKRLTKEIESLKTQSANGDPKTAEELQSTRAELETVRKRVAEQENALKGVAAEGTEEYQSLVKTYEKAFGKTLQRFESFAGKGTGDRLADALVMPMGKLRTDAIDAALEDLKPEHKTRVLTQIEDVERAVDAINEFRADLPAKFDEISRQREQAAITQREQVEKQLESDFGKIVGELPNDNVFLRPIDSNVPGAEEWNGAIKNAQAIALKNLKPGSTLQETSTLLVKGAHYDIVQKYALEQRKIAIEALARLAEYDKSSPDFKGTSRKSPEQKLTPGERYHKALESMKAGNQAA